MKRIIKRLTAMAMMILLLLQCIPINTYAQAQTVGEQGCGCYQKI